MYAILILHPNHISNPLPPSHLTSFTLLSSINPTVSQVATRLITFSLNLYTARSLTPELYGISAVQFHLINTTILFISREGFRRACLRVPNPHTSTGTNHILHSALLVIPIGALSSLTIIITLLLLLITRPSAQTDSPYQQALIMQGIAAFIELIAEPLYILASAQLLLRLRVVVEALSLTVKGLFTLYLLQQNHVDSFTGVEVTMSPAVAFSWGQIAFSSITLVGYFGYFSIMQPHVITQLLLTPFSYFSNNNTNTNNSSNNKERRDTLRLAGTFSFQAIEKLVLAEGTKMVAATTQSAYHQGIYGLVSNLGSLVVRTFFQPLEEAAFLAFSHSSNNNNSSSRSKKRKLQVSSSSSTTTTTTITTKEVALLKALLQTALFLGCIGAAFAPAYSHLALLLGYSTRWANTEAPLALAAYGLLLLPLLAVNGILEAYVHAVANERELYQANMCLVGAAIGHIGVCIATQHVDSTSSSTAIVVLVKGSLGLIIADGVNMVVRIIFCLWFIRRRLQRGMKELFLSSGTIVALVMSMVVTCVSAAVLVPEASLFSIDSTRLEQLDRYRVVVIQGVGFMTRVLVHVGIGVMCLIGVVMVGYREERQALKEAWALSKEKKKG